MSGTGIVSDLEAFEDIAGLRVEVDFEAEEGRWLTCSEGDALENA